jgi:hypothetical protein
VKAVPRQTKFEVTVDEAETESEKLDVNQTAALWVVKHEMMNSAMRLVHMTYSCMSRNASKDLPAQMIIFLQPAHS